MRAWFLLLLLCSLCGYAQQHPIFIDAYSFPKPGAAERIVTVEMSFGKYQVLSVSGDTAGLATAGDIMIDVVFTDYPATASLSVLNQNRVEAFLARFPAVDRNRIRSVNLHRQLNGAQKENAQHMFHGLVILYRPRQTLETMRHDWTKISEILSPLQKKDTVAAPRASRRITSGTDSPITPAPKKTTQMQAYATFVYEFDKRKDKLYKDDSIIIAPPREALRQGWITDEVYRLFRKHELVKLHFRTRQPVAVRPSRPDIREEKKPELKVPDSTVLEIFRRNKWKNTVIVGDVTGSMYPYTSQLLAWLQLFSLDSLTHDFIFFNDGDNTPDHLKRTGSTGGIYGRNCSSFEEVQALVRSTMMKGGGGDCAENNIEALLAADKMFPKKDYQIMIADNWAPIRDKTLIPLLKMPVRIVLCGVFNGAINVDYLNLARATKGSLHVMEQDLHQLALVNEGEIISIGRNRYQLRNGAFVMVTEVQSL
ncbi:MAG TPA: hypothetical protein VFZ78_10370 [Flavisolibacter sp.]